MVKTGFYPAEILIPAVNDMKRWACIACDQFTSEEKYWKELAEFVGDAKSALKLILPEIYLNDNAKNRIEEINGNMRRYREEGVFCALPKGYVLTVRKTPFAERRIGIVACVDLEEYDFKAGAKPLVRATEGTIEERIPPRLKIRENASIELPHILILYDDEKREIAESLFYKREKFKKIYDFDLNMGGGHIEGYFIPESENLTEAFSRLLDGERLIKKYGSKDLFAFAVGDGNHSLATAKAHWDKIKQSLSASARENHPARYALAEFVNIYDEGIRFEPIFRFVSGVNAEEFIEQLTASVGGHYKVIGGGAAKEVCGNNSLPCVISGIDAFIKEYISLHGGKVDYVHGEINLSELVKSDNSSVGVMPDKLDKSELFPFVSKCGAFPRKTFSMGEGVEKRYYLEGKHITTEEDE